MDVRSSVAMVSAFCWPWALSQTSTTTANCAVIVATPTGARSATTARLNPCKKKSMPLVNNLPLLDGHPAMIHPKEVRDLAVMFDVHNAEVSLLAGFKGPDAVGSA